MSIDITKYRIRIERFGPGRGYISTGIAEIYSSSITGSDIHYRMLNHGVINIPIEMLHDDLAGRNNARCIYVCGKTRTFRPLTFGTMKFCPRTFSIWTFCTQDVSHSAFLDLDVSLPDISDQIVSPPDIFGPGLFVPCLFRPGRFSP